MERQSYQAELQTMSKRLESAEKAKQGEVCAEKCKALKKERGLYRKKLCKLSKALGGYEMAVMNAADEAMTNVECTCVD
jgi:hypothetical protein